MYLFSVVFYNPARCELTPKDGDSLCNLDHLMAIYSFSDQIWSVLTTKNLLAFALMCTCPYLEFFSNIKFVLLYYYISKEL